MPRNGSGTYTLPQPPFVAGTVISSAAVNSDFSDIASALTGSLPRDGQAGMTGQMKLPDGSAPSPSMSFTNEMNTGFARPATGTIGVDILGVQIATITASGWIGPVSGGVPIGTVVDFAGSTAPTQWYLCFGQAVSRTTYALLFAIIGTTYGVGDGSTTFNLPDIRGQTIFGKDDMGGSASSRITPTFYGNSTTTLGSLGGNQARSLGTSNLPAYTPTGTITNGAITSTAPGQQDIVGGGGSQVLLGNLAPINVNAVAITSTQAASTFTGNDQGGSSAAFSDIPPAFILNKMIYAGA